MVRFVKYRAKSTKDLSLKSGKYRVFGGRNFIDPFPLGFGTVPEKMVYQALSLRGIPFYFLNDVRFQFPEIEFDKTYQADFVLPTLGVIIEVNGAYWHSKPGAIDSDAFKYAVYQQAGYRVIIWWDFDILANLALLFANDPQLRQYGIKSSQASSELTPMSRKKTDTSKGIRTLNKKRGLRSQYKKKSPGAKIRKTKTYGSYVVK